MRTKEEAHQEYVEKLKRWREKGQIVPDLRPVTSQDVMLVAMSLHRCNNKQFKQVTSDVLDFLNTNDVITSEDVLTAGVCTLPAFYRRMDILKKANMIRRESRIYYMATPRLKEFIAQYKRLIK